MHLQLTMMIEHQEMKTNEWCIITQKNHSNSREDEYMDIIIKQCLSLILLNLSIMHIVNRMYQLKFWQKLEVKHKYSTLVNTFSINNKGTISVEMKFVSKNKIKLSYNVKEKISGFKHWTKPQHDFCHV
jgi:hypothetical protein